MPPSEAAGYRRRRSGPETSMVQNSGSAWAFLVADAVLRLKWDAQRLLEKMLVNARPLGDPQCFEGPDAKRISFQTPAPTIHVRLGRRETRRDLFDQARCTGTHYRRAE